MRTAAYVGPGLSSIVSNVQVFLLMLVGVLFALAISF